MPKQVQVLIGMTCVGLVAELIRGFVTSGFHWMGFFVSLGLLVGILRGSEGSRTILQGVAAVGALLTAAYLLLLVVLTIQTGSMGWRNQAGVLSFGVAGFILAQYGYAWWCLSQPEVKQWMFQRSVFAMDDWDDL